MICRMREPGITSIIFITPNLTENGLRYRLGNFLIGIIMVVFNHFSILILALLVVSCNSDADKKERHFPESRSPRRFFDLFGKFLQCTHCTCGKSNRGGARFLGGEHTDTHEFPWLATILVKNTRLVSGVLINDRYVLTAASQMLKATAPEIKISLGEYDRCHVDVSSVNASVETVIPHPEFSFEARAHDLALLRLSRSTHFERRVSPICLPQAGSTYLGTVGTVAGWTENEEHNRDEESKENRSCRPRKLGLPILSRRECLRGGIKPTHYHEESGCAGVIGPNPIFCNSDAGTSIMHRSYSGYYDLVGILSDLNNCNGTIGTAVFTKVGSHLDWIHSKTKDACYCLKPFEIPEIKSQMYAY
ncbi:hypothetical protein QAD02_018034 [Eretmocerus hayati]|uniref:Uncharacterized protein n=1 Tax=Eretmocerus hayati TaxID=131215 RepID=A0ACC2PIK6_9HYME|nr:hypothetical protein QAD02_018034 [Eretmocerus hayati]